MPGFRKARIVERIKQLLSSSGDQLLSSSFVGSEADLPWRLVVQFANGARRTYDLYFWTIGHGGKTRAVEEYRIQMTLRVDRRLLVGMGTTILLGYYHESVDRAGRIAGNQPPEGMEVFVAWDPLQRLRFGESPSCQVRYPLMCEAFFSGKSHVWRQLSADARELVIAFRPEYLSSYLKAASGGHNLTIVEDLSPVFRG